MKKWIRTLFLAAVPAWSVLAQQPTPVAQMEKLSRGVVAVRKADGGNFVSWRLLGTDPATATFCLLRDGSVIASGLGVSSYTDSRGTADSRYQVVTYSGDTPLDTSAVAATWADIFRSIRLDRPAGGQTPDGVYYAYMPQECSAADLDGDGDYELVVKWLPTNQKDNSESGYTGNCILDAYRMDGTRLWRVDLGKNIRSGSHYTQFLVYDFDLDGRAEMICKTAPGSVDGMGQYVTEAADKETIRTANNTADYRSESGYVMTGPEYLTVFDGLTGRAVHTVWYNPNRGFTTGASAQYNAQWGDSYGNRGDRFLACVAWLGGAGERPSAVMTRGYYTRAYLWAVDFDGSKLATRWLHASVSGNVVELTDANGKKTTKSYRKNTSGIGNYYTAYGQGCHSIAAGDVDGDGFDEIMFGGAAIDHDGSLLYSTGLRHGDAHHLGDLLPDRPGLEFMMPHEYEPWGWHVRDAATGELLYHVTGSDDTARGVAADIDAAHRGYEFWTSDTYDVYAADGSIVSTAAAARPSLSHRIYWDGTAYDNLLDKTVVTDGKNNRIMNFATYGESTQWGAKGYPCLSADLFGDWREEVVLFNKTDSCTLNIFTTTAETRLRVPTLMHDHLYRLSIAWQQTAYNQPPHLGYYLPDSVGGRIVYSQPDLRKQQVEQYTAIVPVEGRVANCTRLSVSRTLLNGKVIKYVGLADDFTWNFDDDTKTFRLEGTPTQTGEYAIVLKTTGNVLGTELTDTIRVVVTEQTGISDAVFQNPHGKNSHVYDLQGRRIGSADAGSSLTKGVYIVRQGRRALKVVHP